MNEEASLKEENKNDEEKKWMTFTNRKILDSLSEMTESQSTGQKKKKKKKKKGKKEDKENEVKSQGIPELVSEIKSMDISLEHGYGANPTPALLPSNQNITSLFSGKNFPPGEIFDHPTIKKSDQLRDVVNESLYSELREAAQVHRLSRQDIKPGISMIDIVHHVESSIKSLFGNFENPLSRGIAFPTGVSLNNCAAHYTPNYGDKRILQAEDVIKIDIGTHINGHIIDSAFTLCFRDEFRPLLDAVKEATNTGVRASGIDVRLCDIGEQIQEVMESHEVTIKGKTYPIKCIRNLNGHSIGQYQIHAGKSVPLVKGGEQTRMEEGEIYAIETFGSTGKGYVNEDVDDDIIEGHFIPLRSGKSRQLLSFIENHFGTLAFCKRWLDDLGEEHSGLMDRLTLY